MLLFIGTLGGENLDDMPGVECGWGTGVQYETSDVAGDTLKFEGTAEDTLKKGGTEDDLGPIGATADPGDIPLKETLTGILDADEETWGEDNT